MHSNANQYNFLGAGRLYAAVAAKVRDTAAEEGCGLRNSLFCSEEAFGAIDFALGMLQAVGKEVGESVAVVKAALPLDFDKGFISKTQVLGVTLVGFAGEHIERQVGNLKEVEP